MQRTVKFCTVLVYVLALAIAYEVWLQAVQVRLFPNGFGPFRAELAFAYFQTLFSLYALAAGALIWAHWLVGWIAAAPANSYEPSASNRNTK